LTYLSDYNQNGKDTLFSVQGLKFKVQARAYASTYLFGRSGTAKEATLPSVAK